MPQELIRSIVKVVNSNLGSTGSGFLLKGGFIATAYHVIEGGKPVFYACSESHCFNEEIAVDDEPVLQLSKEQGDFVLFEVLEKEKYAAHYLMLVDESEYFHTKSFQTFGFPYSHKINGIPYNHSTINDTTSTNEFGIRKITLSNPGNIGKGYSGGPVFVPPYGVIGMITQVWEEVSVGLPVSEIKQRYPNGEFFDCFFPRNDNESNRCLVVYRDGESKAIDFCENEVGLASDYGVASNQISYVPYRIGHERIHLQAAVNEATIVILWADSRKDIVTYTELNWLAGATLILFNYGITDAKALHHLISNYENALCFPRDAKSWNSIGLPIVNFAEIEGLFRDDLTGAYRVFFEYITNEVLSLEDKFRDLVSEFDYVAGKEDIKRIARKPSPFKFICLEGTPNCGIEILAKHGIRILEKNARKNGSSISITPQILDWEEVVISELEELLEALNIGPENWFASNGPKVFVLRNILTVGMLEKQIDDRARIIRELHRKCDIQTIPESWNGSVYFFLLSTTIDHVSLYDRVDLRSSPNFDRTTVLSLKADDEPLYQLEQNLKRDDIPTLLRDKIGEKLANREEIPDHVGHFLLELCSHLDATHIYHQELCRL